jgi:hypothetical protein
MTAEPIDPRAEYTRRLARWDREIASGLKRHEVLANLRLAVAGLAAVIGWLVYSGSRSAGWFALPVIAFVALVIAHDRVLKHTERSRRARRIYERGMARLDGTWTGAGADGHRFAGAESFAGDLDLFGSGSLFQYLNTTRTEIGEDVLAQWLLHGADPDEVVARQIAVTELRPMVDFRESLAVTAADVHVGRTSALARWASLATPPFPAWTTALFLALSAAGIAILVAVGLRRLPLGVAFLWLGLQLGITLLWRSRSAEAFAAMDDAAADLSLLKVLLERLESQGFTAPRLNAIRDSLPADGQLASQSIASLQRLVTALDSCRNQVFAPIAVYFQIASLLMLAIARWRTVHGPAIASWLHAVGEAEAFAALATFAYEHPANPFPEIDATRPLFEATALAHPLIHASAAIANDVALGGDAPHVLMVSGSNMSGKSTLLRSIGVNVVLALAGAPVQARRLRMSPLVLGVSLRVEDSLQGGHSRFYAEILRLRSVVDLTRGRIPLLFMLDEILAGTNSFDRRIGAEAIVRSLARAGAIGLVTTHDLALTEVVQDLGVPAANVHFEDRIEDGKMVFDYQMRPGVVERSNAIALMRAIGLDV